MVGLLHAMAFMVLLLVGWVIWNNKPLPLPSDHLCLVVTFCISVANLAFSPRIWACFSVELRFFLKTCGLLVLIEICLFFGLVFCRVLFCRLLFSQFLWHFCRFNLLLKAHWACFCENLLILRLFFAFATLILCLIFLLISCFVEFSCVATSPVALRWLCDSPQTGCAWRITPLYM